MQLSLKCLNCGAALTVPETASQMACGYCGVVQQIQREGGGVWLSLEKALADVKASSDRAANEMTLRRLREERDDLRRQLEEVQTRTVEDSNQSSMSGYRIVSTVIFLIVATIIVLRMLDRDLFYSFD